MARKRLKKACILCHSSSNDEVTYGETFDNGSIVVHHYCLLFTNCCEQNGEDDEGFAGFLFHDIKKAAQKIKKLNCYCCKRRGANIICRAKGCSRCYHTGCALRKNANFQFHSSFPVYCPNHHEHPVCTEERPLDNTCGICYENLVKNKSILIPCCKNSWFHKKCLQKYALTSGYYHFKCPLCANRDKCIEELPALGIYVPHRDAQWELDNDFDDMAAPPAVVCEFCDSGEHADENHLWKMCDVCGSAGVHWTCLHLTESENFTCRNCFEILERKEKQPKSKTPRKKKRSSDDGDKVFFLVSDEELCSTSSDEEEIVRPRRKSRRKLVSESENENNNPEKSIETYAIKSSETEEEITKPKTGKKTRILSSSSDDDFSVLRPRKRMKIVSSPEGPSTSSRRLRHRL